MGRGAVKETVQIGPKSIQVVKDCVLFPQSCDTCKV